MIRKSLTQKRDNQLTETEQSLYTLYKEEFKEVYHLILSETSTSFFNVLNKRAKISLSKQFNDFSPESITKIENLIQNQIYPLEYKTAYTAMTVIKRKQESHNALKPFSGNYIPHCSNKETTSLLYHTCGKRLYNYKCRNDLAFSVSLMICTACDMAYKSDLVKAHCLICKEDFYTKILIGEEPNGVMKHFATWKKYHCDCGYNEKMKCLSCSSDLYFIQGNGLVHCDICDYDIDAQGLIYKCVKCNKGFSSEAKAYNPYEKRYIYSVIKDALVKGIKAKPEHLNNSCCDIDTKKAKYWHYQSNCNGEMFNGEMNKKKIVICSKCDMVYYHSEFQFKCQFCCDIPKAIPIPRTPNEKCKEEREHAPTDYHSSNKSFGNIPFRNSDSKKAFFIPIPLTKRNSNCQLIKKFQSNNNIPNIPNYSALKCNLAKRFSCYNVMNFEEKIKINLDESHLRIKSSSLNSNSTSCSNQYTENNSNSEDSLINKFNIEDYTVIKQIGEGSFGKIFLVESKSKQQFALKKILASNAKEMESLKHEYDILISLQKASNSPALIHIYGIQSNQLDPTTYIMYVLMELGSIDWEKEIENRSKKRQHYTETELIKIGYSLVKTFAQIQRNKISHRDIKPQNILLCDNAQYKIADFGEAKEFSSESNKRVELQTLRGTELYMSPILFQGLRNKTKALQTNKYIKYNAYKSDVFSLGLCVLFAAVLSYNALYDIRELTDMISIKIVLNKYLKRNYSEKLIDLMMLMLEVDEEARCDFIELEKRFEQSYSKILSV